MSDTLGLDVKDDGTYAVVDDAGEQVTEEIFETANEAVSWITAKYEDKEEPEAEDEDEAEAEAEDKMKCPECGASINADSEKCSECGASLKQSPPKDDK